MKAILLDGSSATDSTGDRVRAALATQLQALGWGVEHLVLRDKKISHCAGDFLCWTRTPGMCNVNDDNREIAAAIVASDLMVYLTPVTFGGYSSALKRMVDHQIQNLLPFFNKIEGETHHKKRYETYPDFLAVGWMDTPDAEAERVFRHLVGRNALNFHAMTYVAGVAFASQSDGEMAAAVQHWLNDLQRGQSSRHVGLPDHSPAAGETHEIRRALLLVGSPRTSKSTSHSLGGYLFEQLHAHSVRTETMHLYTALGSPARTQALFDAVEAADLVTLAFPLYVDSLPAPVIETLEGMAAYRQVRATRRPRFVAIANCGFPEAHHNLAALAICGTFARQAGFEWAGSLALGGGEMVGGVPLAQKGGQTVRIRKALDLAAAALVQGQVLPKAAQDLLAQPAIPHWMYRMMGDLGWKQQAKRYDAKKLLRQQPYPARGGLTPAWSAGLIPPATGPADRT